MKTVTDFPHKMTETADMTITLADGCRLSARVWMPENAPMAPVPAILEFLPYRKRDGTTARDALTHPYLAGHGYACLRVDMRGSGDSEGLMEDEYTAQELADACEVIAWIAAQPWCAGPVGMMGISWGGFNALQVAALQPPALKAIITLCSTTDRYADDIHYKGGCLLNENLGWGATMWSYSSRAPDPALRPDDWRKLWLTRLEAEPFLPEVWLRHQRRDDYWRHGSVCEDYTAITAATLAVGGWGDSYKNAVAALVENLAAPVKGIVGPWVHKYPHFAVPGPQIGFLQEALRWWDHWLKGVDTGIGDDPAMRLYLMDGLRPARWHDHRPGRWISAAQWPAPDIDTRILALGPGGALGVQDGDDTRFDVTVASPQHCGMEGGEFCAIWLGPEMPGDQRHDDALSACFDSAPMHETDVVGAPVVRLRLRSDRPVAHVAIRLNHIHPDGASARITWGVLNLTHRDGHATPEALIPGEEFTLAVTLDQIAYRLPAGHRLRVAISSAYWPMLWPAPEPVTLTLTQGTLELPVRPAAEADEWQFEPAEAAAPEPVNRLRDPHHIRRTEIDQQSGVITLVIEDDFGVTEHLDHGMITAGIARERWDIHPDDPLSARGTTHWTQEHRRGDWSVKTQTHAQMWSDATAFHLSARIEAWEGETMIYERDLKRAIPRDHL